MDRAIRLASLVCRERFSCAASGASAACKPVEVPATEGDPATSRIRCNSAITWSSPQTLDQLHRIVADLCVLADLEDRHDIGVVQLGAARASRRNRSTAELPTACRGKTFSATRRPSDNCSAS